MFVKNINIISNLLKENKYAMFLRKVNSSFPDCTIKEIMNTNFNHKYELLHNQAKQTNSINLYYKIYTFLFIMLVCFITIDFTKVFMNSY